MSVRVTCNACGDRRRRKHLVRRFTATGQWVCDDIHACMATRYKKAVKR